MKKLKFKLIPFLISLFIVIGAVTGICLYSYYKYENNKILFVADYFHYEDYKSVTTEEQIENFVKMESKYYQLVTDELRYFDVKSGKEFNEPPSKDSKNSVQGNGATWSNGVLHIPGYFDLKFYTEITWNSDQETWVYSYYAFVYNVNYFSNDVINNLYFCFVNGTGESEYDKANDSGELYGTTKLNLVLQEVKDGKNGTPNTINEPKYKYSGTSSTYPMYIHDNKASGEILGSDDDPHVYRLTSMTESNSETSSLDDEETTGRWLSELSSASFSIFYTKGSSITENENDVVEIVRGTYNRKYETAKKFNTAYGTDENIHKGFAGDLYKAGYGKFIFKRIFIQGLVTFIISGILATLFYLIWQDDLEENPKVKSYKPLKKKKAK